MSDNLTSFAVSDDDDRTVYCGCAGVTWGYVCTDTACKGRSYFGWEDANDVAQGAVAHLIWHAAGMPECQYCGSTLSGDAAQTGECPPSECSERDEGEQS